MVDEDLDSLFPEAAKVPVEAGADLTRRDTACDGTPFDWAMHGEQQ